jgi:acetylglutamate kinase
MQAGRRVTDEATLKLVTMVYAGFINKNIVAKLQALHCNAIGLSGADGNLIKTKKRPIGEIDFGFVGDIVNDAINQKLINNLLQNDYSIVVAPITHDGDGQLLNTNADTVAATIAIAMATKFNTVLIYCFDKKGVLQDVNDESTLIKQVNEENIQSLKKSFAISEGMLPKVDNAMGAIRANVKRVVIGHANDFAKLVAGDAGTNITA